MGAAASSSGSSGSQDTRAFLIERIVASMCDYCSPPTLMMGIFGRGADKNSPYSGIGLRIGNQPIVELREYTKNPTSIKYEFENNTTLHIFRTELQEVAYRLKTPELDEVHAIDPLLVRMFKPIGMDNAKPLDELKEIMK